MRPEHTQGPSQNAQQVLRMKKHGGHFGDQVYSMPQSQENRPDLSREVIGSGRSFKGGGGKK